MLTHVAFTFYIEFSAHFQRFVLIKIQKKVLPIFTSSDIFLKIMGMLGYNLRDSFITLSRYFNCESSFMLAGLCESLKISFTSSWIFSWHLRSLPIQKSVQLMEIAVVSWPCYYTLLFKIKNYIIERLNFFYILLTAKMNVDTCALKSSSVNETPSFSFMSNKRSIKAFLFCLSNLIINIFN